MNHPAGCAQSKRWKQLDCDYGCMADYGSPGWIGKAAAIVFDFCVLASQTCLLGWLGRYDSSVVVYCTVCMCVLVGRVQSHHVIAPALRSSGSLSFRCGSRPWTKKGQRVGRGTGGGAHGVKLVTKYPWHTTAAVQVLGNRTLARRPGATQNPEAIIHYAPCASRDWRWASLPAPFVSTAPLGT